MGCGDFTLNFRELLVGRNCCRTGLDCKNLGIVFVLSMPKLEHNECQIFHAIGQVDALQMALQACGNQASPVDACSNH